MDALHAYSGTGSRSGAYHVIPMYTGIFPLTGRPTET
jgi:hypothetical protein